MAELWRKLVDSADPALSALLSLNKVSISRATADSTIELTASRILNRREFKKLERAFAAAFPGVQVELRVRYPALKAAVEQDVKLSLIHI